jgi:hypothetical protein
MTTTNRLQFWINSRSFARQMLGLRNKRKEREYIGDTMAHLSFTTRCLADEIRKVEKQLGRPHRYLPASGFYQGVIW